MTVEYQRRLEKHYDELKWLYCELYPNGQGRFEELCAAMEQWYKERNKKWKALEAQLAEEENLEIVRMVKAVKMDNKELTAFLKAYASGMISLPEGMLQEGNTENEETEEYEDEA